MTDPLTMKPIGISLTSLGYPNPQIPLLPQREHLLLIPIFAPLTQLKVKMPHHPRQDSPHLPHGETLTNTIPRSDTKWLQHVPLISHKPLFSRLQPAFRDKGVGIREVGCRVEGAVLKNAYRRLLIVRPRYRKQESDQEVMEMSYVRRDKIPINHRAAGKHFP